MSLSYYDKENLKGIVNNAMKSTKKEQAAQGQTLERIADALEALTTEMKALRADLNPELSKAKIKLPSTAPKP